MKPQYLENIESRIIALLPTDVMERRAAYLKDSCSELSRLVASWMIEYDKDAESVILKGDNVCDTTLSHDILASKVGDKYQLLDPTIWQFFPKSKSIFVGEYGTVADAIKSATMIYGGTWIQGELLHDISEEDTEEWLKIVNTDISESK